MPEQHAQGSEARRRRRCAIGAILLLGFASAFLLQGFGYPQGAYLAQIHALADGTPQIDRYRDYSGDISYVDGHYYSNKAPGLAFVSLPLFEAFRALGLPHGVHVLGLWAVLLPALLLLVLVGLVAERLEPGYGTAAAVALGAGTLVLPFSGLFYAHALSTFLGFAAFFLLWRERHGRRRLALLLGAGTLAGFAATTEYPLALTGAVLGLYAIARTGPVARGLAYTGGVAVGILPLLLYNRWAFGGFTRLSYSHLVREDALHRRIVLPSPAAGGTAAPGGRGAPPAVAARVTQGFYDLGLPHPRVALELLFADRGLLRLTPIVAVGVLGLVLVYRRGWRAEALVGAAVATAFLLYDAGFNGAFGGWGPGPRYLMPMLPFVAFPLALALRRAPAVTLSLGLVSAAVMAAASSTLPLLPNRYVNGGEVADPDRWLDLVRAGQFQRTLASTVGLGHGWIAIAPFLAALGLAIVLAARATLPVRFTRQEAAAALVAVAGWAVLATWAPDLLRHDRAARGATGAAVVALLALAVVALALVAERAGTVVVARAEARRLAAFAGPR